MITWFASAIGGLNATTFCFARRTASASRGASLSSRRRVSAIRSVTITSITRRIVSCRNRGGGTSRLDSRAAASASPTTGRWAISSGPNSRARSPSSRSWL